MKKFDKNKVTSILTKVATEASTLYQDEPLDYKGRTVTTHGIIETGTDARNLDIIEIVVNNSEGNKILDVGIAYGIYSVVLKREFGFEVIGIEHPANIDSYCRFPMKAGIEIAPCDLHQDTIPYPDNTFHTVIAAEVVEHLLISSKAFFKKIYRLLKPGGRLIVSTPNFASLQNIILLISGTNPAGQFPDEDFKNESKIGDPRTHPREYTVKEIGKTLIESGFTIANIYTKTNLHRNSQNWRSQLLNTISKITPKNKDQIFAVAIK